MIRLAYEPKPKQLTKDLVKKLTADFIAKNTAVWDKTYIKQALLKMSHGKCCYCECNITEESSYIEVEHFLPKKHFPNKVLEWKNLLPACKRCNGRKGSHNTKLYPIVHPVKDNPQDHFYFTIDNDMLEHKTDKGEITKNLLYLNDFQRLITPRNRIRNGLTKQLSLVATLAKAHKNISDNQEVRQEIENSILNLMEACLPDAHEHVSFRATVLLHDENYQAIHQIFVLENLWTAEFQTLEDNVKKCALPEK